MRLTFLRLLPVLAVVLAGLVVAAPTATADTTWTPRPEQYPDTATTKTVKIPMSDGVILLGDVMRPVDAGGTVVETPLPVVVTINAYNKEALASAGGGVLAGAPPAYLVKRGYIQVTVDVRGTGTSGGVWQVFGAREQLDAKEIIEWAASQPWSDGSVAMTGASYLGISQLFAAGQNPRGLKAIFPQVASAEVYRDIVASGGMIDAGFMPLWLGLVTGTGLIPPASAPEASTLTNMLGHVLGGGPNTLALGLSALTGGERAYYGPWYEERSTLIQSVPNITVPTFLIGGEYDLFQRGTPLVFQALHDRGVPVKMIFGPWDHLEGSSGADVVDAGHGSLGELQLRWFDHHVKGLPDPTLDADIPDFTYHEIGSGDWIGRDAYLDEQQPSMWNLSGSTMTAGAPATLTQGEVTDGKSTILPIALAGLCTRSASQWTAGLDGMLKLPNPCKSDARLDDLAGVSFDTAPLTGDLEFLGPINAHLNVSSTTGDGLLAVQVQRVSPDGAVEPITAGWQVMSLAELDEAKSVKLGTEIIQPWHPFTKASEKRLAPNEVVGVDVEIFPTGAVIPAGDKLRLAVHTWEIPHLLPTLTQLPTTAATVVTIHAGGTSPSRLVLPALSTPPTIVVPGPTASPTPVPMPTTPLPSTPLDPLVDTVTGLLSGLGGLSRR